MTPEEAQALFARWHANLAAAKLDGYASDPDATWMWKGRRVVSWEEGVGYRGWDYGARLVARQAFGYATLGVRT